jgi:hypothetical protein
MADDKHKSDDLVPQADQQASTDTAKKVGQQGEQANVLNEQAKEQAKAHKEQ